jgi:hypothetical protein
VALEVEALLHADGHAVERAANATRRALVVEARGLGAGLVVEDRGERVQPRIEGMDPVEVRVDELTRRELPPREAVDHRAEGEGPARAHAPFPSRYCKISAVRSAWSSRSRPTG